MMPAQRGDAFAGPGVAMAGFKAIADEKAGDQIVARDQPNWATAMMSADVLLRCPRRRLGNRISL